MTPIEPVLPWALDKNYPRWTETLRDLSQVVVRPVTAQDAAEERSFIEALSPQSCRYRFLGQVRHPSEALITQLTDIDYQHDVAFAAVVKHDSREEFVGVARYNTDPTGMTCEFAVTVLDDWQHKGLGTVLVRHLIDVARARGIRYLYSVDSAENLAMADLARFLGFNRQSDTQDSSQVVHSLWL
ncbi:GNAT family N-acetyltransferase [Arenimonas oryziterrae]|nr:GNAT family N-acetyltransferase [Arenimonas oryziterrae]